MRKNKKQLFNNKNKGVSLLEFIIAMAIFIIVITLVLGLFGSSLKGQRKNIAMQDVQENARYLLSFISKEIRMSEISGITSNALELIRSDGEQISYVFNDNEGQLERTVAGDPGASGCISSSDVFITGSFYALGVGDSDDQQVRVTIIMTVEKLGTKTEERAKINVQTTLSQRNLDI